MEVRLVKVSLAAVLFVSLASLERLQSACGCLTVQVFLSPDQIVAWY